MNNLLADFLRRRDAYKPNPAIQRQALFDNAPVGSVGMPGGLLTAEPEKPKGATVGGLLTAGAMMPGPTGDVLGPLADAYMYATDPSSRKMSNYALSAAGLLPFVPSVGAMRFIDVTKPLSEQKTMVKAAITPPKYMDAYKKGVEFRKRFKGKRINWEELPSKELEFFGRYDAADSAFFKSGLNGLSPPRLTEGTRYGNAPSGHSYNQMTGTTEAGVSMATVKDPRFDDAWERNIGAIFLSAERPKKKYQGFVLDPSIRGGDNEPLMIAVRKPEMPNDWYKRLLKIYKTPEAVNAALENRGLRFPPDFVPR
jgi:hypothetical protein